MQLVCTGDYIVPRNIPQAGVVDYPYVLALTLSKCLPLVRTDLGPNQACSLFGSTAGSSTIIGSDYIKIAINLKVDDLWRRNLPVLFGMFVFFSILQVIFLEFPLVS